MNELLERIESDDIEAVFELYLDDTVVVNVGEQSTEMNWDFFRYIIQERISGYERKSEIAEAEDQFFISVFYQVKKKEELIRNA